MAIKFFFPENLLSPTTVLLASLFPKTYISSLKGDLFSFENNCWEACLRKGIEMFLLYFGKKFFSLGICDQLLNRISRKLGLGRQSFAGEHVFYEKWNPATVPCRCGGKEDTVSWVFQLPARVRTVHTGTCSGSYSSDCCGPTGASCKHSSPASLWRDSLSPSTDSLGLQSSWEIPVSASGCSSLTQLELTLSLPSDKKKKSESFCSYRVLDTLLSTLRVFNHLILITTMRPSIISIIIFHK